MFTRMCTTGLLSIGVKAGKTVSLTSSLCSKITDVMLSSEQKKDITDYVEKSMKSRNVPGLSISVVKGQESWTLPLGHADLGTRRPVTEDTLFGVGSITKSLTALLLGVLVDEADGKITFDTPVAEILGDEYAFPDDLRARATTLKDILGHRTGLSGLNLAVLFGTPKGLSRADFSKRLKYLPETKDFRTEWEYSNFMYMVAAHVAEKVWGASWEESLKTRLFDKIGMTSTEVMTNASDLIGERYARPYVFLHDEVKEADPSVFILDQLGPAGGVASNSTDMVKLIRFLLNKGKLEDGTALIKGSTLQQQWQPLLPLSPIGRMISERLCPQWPVADVSTGYGMGWFTNVYRGQRKIWHAGGLHSYFSLLWLFPDSDIGLSIITNGPSTKLDNNPMDIIFTSLYYITDILMAEKPWLDHSTAATFPKPWFDMTAFMPPPPDKLPVEPEAPLMEYTGVYVSPIIGEFVVSLNEGELEVTLNNLEGVLVPEKDGVFGIEARGRLEFMSRSEKDNPARMYKAKFIKGKDGFGELEVIQVPPLEPAVRFTAKTGTKK